MTDYIKLSELIEKMQDLAPGEADCEFLNERIDADTLIDADFNIDKATTEALDLLTCDQDIAALMSISADYYNDLKKQIEQGSDYAYDRLTWFWDIALDAVYSRICQYQDCSTGLYLANMLKDHGYTDSSLVHPCITAAIDSYISDYINDDAPNIFTFEAVLDDWINNYFGIYSDLPEDFEGEDLATKFDFIKDHTEGFYTPEKDVETPERVQEVEKDKITLTPLNPDTCYVDPASNRAVLIKAQPFDGELEGISRFREDFPEWGVIPIYTWHPEYDSPHKSEFYNSTDFLLDLLGTETLPFPWQPAGKSFIPVGDAAADRGFHIVPIEVRENSRSPYRVGHTWGGGYIADGFAVTPKVDGKLYLEVLLEVQAELDMANAYYQGKGFEAQVYDLETGKLLDTEHTVGFAEGLPFNTDIFIKAATKADLVLDNCPDFLSVKQQLKDKDLPTSSSSNSLSDLAQEAKTASKALSNNERNIDVKDREER